ncbi:gtp-binding protein [Colletotrichum tabaci]|uniref:Obg-like ATPase 1 n=1 Tax=Colletotrichum tabaci TaxID=1209068 RepID=A0AAV9T582_9PEZI
MPPKKQVVEEKILLGRPGNNLKSGIVGLANVGKSTLFQAITKCNLGNPANFPYATIDPEEARVIVPDDRYDWLCEKYNPKSRVPANLTVYDIAGLTRGASTGAGLGNAFLSHIRAVDAIFQVVRCFDDAEIIHVEGDVNPTRDLEIISDELRLKDIEFTEKALENQKKKTRSGGKGLEHKKAMEEQATMEKILQHLKDGNEVRKGNWGPKEVEVINPLFLLTAKPVVYLVNLSEKDFIRKKNKYLPKVAEWVKEHAQGDPIIPISVSFEERLTRYETEAESKEEQKNVGAESALPKIVLQMRKVLNLGSFFTTGTDEVRQWTIRNGTKAPQAAGVIHTDFEKTFIQALVYNFTTLKELGSEAEVKAKGKVMTKGKDYVVEDGDILLIKAGAAKAVRPRSSTKGPLDLDDTPLNDPLSPKTAATEEKTQQRPISGQRSPAAPPSPAPPVKTTVTKDFGFLLRPEIYHSINPVNIPVAFRNSSKQPPADASLEDLLAKGHFRAAAIAAVQELTATGGPERPRVDPADHQRIFSLLYTRLACLTLIDATPIAAQEVRALEDLNAGVYIDETTGEHLVPWELRVLNVRLQALGFSDPRRSVMSYHDLAREAREQISKATIRHDNSARELWKARLTDLGINVTGALIEMDDLAGAARHLSTLKDRGDGKMALSRALLWLHLGDTEAARRSVQDSGEDGKHAERVITALCQMADGEYDAALQSWQDLKGEFADEMVGVNLAVCLLYTGKLTEARSVFEDMVNTGYSSHTLLFNLSTTYELCTERNRNLKLGLVEKVADLDETPRGWEKNNADFKL